MAAQVLVEELDGCRTYLEWVYDVLGYKSPEIWEANISLRLIDFLFGIDFSVYCDGGEIQKDDEIRSKDALEIRRSYAESVGQDAGKSARDVDRIWKSIHGKTSVLELILCLARHLDSMVNEGEDGSMTGLFYRILIHNLRLDEYSDKDFDVMVLDADTGQFREERAECAAECAAEYSRRTTEIEEIWNCRVKKWLDREYFEDGSEGGMFPLEHWKPGDNDQKKVSLWYQMNTWLGENLDDECQFCSEKWANFE